MFERQKEFSIENNFDSVDRSVYLSKDGKKLAVKIFGKSHEKGFVPTVSIKDRSDKEIGAFTFDGTLWMKKSIKEINLLPEELDKQRFMVRQKMESLNQCENLLSQSIPGEKVALIKSESDSISNLLASLGHLKKRGVTDTVLFAEGFSRSEKNRLENYFDYVIEI